MGITPAALECLQTYAWPGNVRELQNAIERAVVLSPGRDLAVTDLPTEVRQRSVGTGQPSSALEVIDDALPLSKAIDTFTRTRIYKALEAAGGNQTEAAKYLGLPQSNLSRLMKRLRLR
jgi:two-component system response regulator HydG